MMRVGFVGWRGMVGSVLLQRMQEEGDFALIDPVFFTTSKIGGTGPLRWQGQRTSEGCPCHRTTKDHGDHHFSCQGANLYSMRYSPSCAMPAGMATGSTRLLHWRMEKDAVIILDPVNLSVMKDGLQKGIKNYIGGNCAVSLMLSGNAWSVQERHSGMDDVAMTYQAACRSRSAKHARASPTDG